MHSLQKSEKNGLYYLFREGSQEADSSRNKLSSFLV